MVIAVEHGIDLLKCTGLDVLVLTPIFKKLPRVLHHLDGGGPQFTGPNFDVGRMQAIGSANLTEVVGLGLATLCDYQDAVVAGTPSQFAFKLLPLAFPRGVVARHQCSSPKVRSRNGTAP